MGVLLPEPARDSPVAGLCRPAGRNAALYAAMGFFPAQQPPIVFKIAQDMLQSGCRNVCPLYAHTVQRQRHVKVCLCMLKHTILLSIQRSDHTCTKLASANDDTPDSKERSNDMQGRLDSLDLGWQAAHDVQRCSVQGALTSLVAGGEQRLCIRVRLEDVLPP